MEDTIFLLLFISGICAWIFILKYTEKKGYSNLFRHAVAGVIGILIMGIYNPPSQEERAEKALIEKLARMNPQERAEYDKDVELKKVRAAAQKAATEKLAAEKKALEEAEIDRSVAAFINCKELIKRRLKAPSTADFPWSADSTQREGQTYVVFSYVDSQNGFGAMLRSQWQCKIRFIGGDDLSLSSWQLEEIGIF